MGARRKPHRAPTPPVYRLAGVVLPPLLRAVMRYEVVGLENIPPEGGFIAVPNHNSHIDPFPWAHVLFEEGIAPVFLAKSSLFETPGVAWAMRATGQVRVDREQVGAAGSLAHARAALRDGHCIGIYPEGSLTRDPDQWPMRGKTGAARLALETGAPVIPIAHWGAQELLPPYTKVPRVRRRRHPVQIRIGPPVVLDDLRGGPVTSATVATATDRIMGAITDELEHVRGAKAPRERFDPKAHGLPLTGKYRPGEDT